MAAMSLTFHTRDKQPTPRRAPTLLLQLLTPLLQLLTPLPQHPLLISLPPLLS